MKESISLSPTPIGEECAQLGDIDYSQRARKECRAFINQLTREFGEAPAGARLKVTTNPHDFGSYLDVVVEFDPENEAASEWAYSVEGSLPEFWDEEAIAELAA